jgi:hypothetical protein
MISADNQNQRSASFPLPHSSLIRSDHWSSDLTDLHGQLERARKHIERRFADFGAVLINLIGQSAKLQQIVIDIRAGVKNEDSMAAMAEMVAAVDDADQCIRALKEQRGFAHGASDANRMLAAVAAHMDELLRYMRMCAITIKITGARTAEIVGFADDMLASVVSARVGLTSLHGALATIEAAISRGEAADSQDRSDEEDRVLADLTGAVQAALLSTRSRQSTLHHLTMSTAGQLVKFETALAQCLSGLQGGDIAGQRIEHIKIGVDLLARARASGEDGAELLHQLLVDQLADLISELNDETARFGSGMEVCKRIASNLDQTVDQTRQQTTGDDRPETQRQATAFQAAVGHATSTVLRVDATSRRLADAGETGLRAIEQQRQNIESIRTANTDVLYMALNTNLRCSRLGTEARSSNSITGELRATSAELNTSTDRIADGLDRLTQLADGLVDRRMPPVEAIRQKWDKAVLGLQQMDEDTHRNSAGLQDHCSHIGNNIDRIAADEDFQNEFSRLLLDCLDRLRAAAADARPHAGAPSQTVRDFGDEVFRTYTMNRERDIHRHIFAVPESIADCNAINLWDAADPADTAPAIMLF